MAYDSAMLASGHCLFRHYDWAGPACITFGISQQWDWIAEQAAGKPAIRRATGGGLVDHEADWTWSLALPASHPLHRADARETYRLGHEVLQHVLRDFAIESQLKPCPRTSCETATEAPAASIPDRCFVRAEVDDLLDPEGGPKLAGAAQKRTRDGLLIQGSLLTNRLPTDAREALAEAMARELAERLELAYTQSQWEPETAVYQSYCQQFESEAWNRRR